MLCFSPPFFCGLVDSRDTDAVVARPPLAKGMRSTVGSAGIHSSDGLIISCICKTKQTEEKQLPYSSQMPLKAYLLNRCIMQKDEEYFLRKVMSG